MKYIQKILTLLLATLMISTMIGTAFATSLDGKIIDTTELGSITIEKTEIQEHEKRDENNNVIIGEDGKPVIVEEKIALEGVTFDAYKIADIVTKAADTNTFTLAAEPVEELVSAWNTKHSGVALEITNTTKYEGRLQEVLEYMLESSEIDFKPTASGTTKLNTNGKAIAELYDLPVGVYLIVESSAPAQIVEKSANFIVSIPMAAPDGDGWVYDIYANPKNESVYSGAVVLKKEGNDSGTILQGVRFKLQIEMVGTDTTEWVNIQNFDGTDTFTTDEHGKIEVEDLVPGYYRFTEIDRGSSNGTALNTDYIIDKTKDYYFTVTTTGKFIAGERPAEGRDLDVETGAKDSLEIIVNNYKPDLEKTIRDRVDTTSWGEMADYNVGDTVYYRLEVDVPHNIADLKTFKITDSPRFVEDNTNSIVVGNSEGEADEELKEHFTVEATTNTVEGTTCKGFVINFTEPKYLANYAGKEIWVYYEAKLLPGAVKNNRADNTASLIYSNEILAEGTPNVTEIKDDTVVYTFGINVAKYLDQKKLDNLAKKGLVTFELYRGNPVHSADAQKLFFKVGTTEGEFILAKQGETDASTELIISEQGYLNIRGLANDTYYLVETQTEPGYNLLNAPLEVNVNISYKQENWNGAPDYKDGTSAGNWLVIKHDVNKLHQTFGAGANNTANKPYAELDVINKKGFDLPLTGGMGTTLFYLTGLSLVVFGTMLLAGFRFRKVSR